MSRSPNGIMRRTVEVDADRLRDSIIEYRDTWELADRFLMRLCSEHPGHSDRAAVNAKLLVVARSYATGIERNIPSSGGQGASLAALADCFLENAEAIDAAIVLLPANANRLTAQVLPAVLEAHARLLAVVRRISRNQRSARSFASKYLHFHRPVVPLYDSVADGVLPSIVKWRRELRVVDPVAGGDEPYYGYVMREWAIAQAARRLGEDPTVKELDYFLLREAAVGR